MVNPVKIVKTAWADAHESVEAFYSGHVFKGMALMGETALDVSIVLAATNEVKLIGRGVSAIGSRLVFLGVKKLLNSSINITLSRNRASW